MLAFRDAGHGAVLIASSSTPVTLEDYIFARFKSAMVSKIRFTRGVRDVVSFAGVAIPIDNEIIC
jgi:hypothetical protein